MSDYIEMSKLPPLIMLKGSFLVATAYEDVGHEGVNVLGLARALRDLDLDDLKRIYRELPQRNGELRNARSACAFLSWLTSEGYIERVPAYELTPMQEEIERESREVYAEEHSVDGAWKL